VGEYRVGYVEHVEVDLRVYGLIQHVHVLRSLILQECYKNVTGVLQERYRSVMECHGVLWSVM
jgi:hypothetical protein